MYVTITKFLELTSLADKTCQTTIDWTHNAEGTT